MTTATSTTLLDAAEGPAASRAPNTLRLHPPHSSNAEDYISRLPDEMLETVFGYVVAIDSPHFNENEPRCLVTITHVCRHWRTLSLNRSALWRNFPINGAQSLWDAYVERSKNTLISVDSGKWTEEMKDRFLFVFQNEERLQQLHLYNLDYDSFDMLLTWLPGPLPHLRSLCLEHQVNFEEQPVLDQEFMAYVAPKLEVLQLVNISLSWGIGLPKLITLAVEQAADVEMDYTLFDVAHTLRQAPDLQCLRLKNVLPDAPPGIWNTDVAEIHLPRMEDLFLESPNASCFHMWFWMDTMIRCIRIHCTDTCTSDDFPLPTPLAYVRLGPAESVVHLNEDE